MITIMTVSCDLLDGMKNLIEKLKDRLWPIGITARIVAGQFSVSSGASMLLYNKEARLEFCFYSSSPELAWVNDLHLTITRGDLELTNTLTKTIIDLNRRERSLIGESVHRWLEMDGISDRMEVVSK